jgi:hypothetical protein
MCAHLALGRYDVHNAENWYERNAEYPYNDLFPQSQRLHESHLRPKPYARQMLLTVRMSDKLHEKYRTFSFKEGKNINSLISS